MCKMNVTLVIFEPIKVRCEVCRRHCSLQVKLNIELAAESTLHTPRVANICAMDIKITG